jgi:hypothetical protein
MSIDRQLLVVEWAEQSWLQSSSLELNITYQGCMGWSTYEVRNCVRREESEPASLLKKVEEV